MKKILFTVSLILASQTSFAQFYPVLHDADGLQIGNVVGFRTAENTEYLDLVSLKGYRAKMNYMVDKPLVPKPEGDDLPGYEAEPYYASANCSGDPVLLPQSVRSFDTPLRQDFSNAFEFLSLAQLYTVGKDRFYAGDLFEFNNASYYIPFDATTTRIEVKSVLIAGLICSPIDRCSWNTWESFGKLMSQDFREEMCPDISVPGGDLRYPKFVAQGYALTSVKPNDPNVTGFRSIKYRSPYRIKWLDFNTILNNGFESPTG